MSKQFAEVQQDDFMKFGGERPSYLEIEDALMKLGGHGVGGNNFKNEMVKLAGWTGGALTTYAQRAAVAQAAFNRIREVLPKASSAEELRAILKSLK
ncbi:hypothetical protein MACH16_05190 [Marinomonas pontica]|jgi:hypothetical protein|uniref:Uncharacterized protein n=1 Tax=Marinomonas pontica TaxID=264739 RepID=A0ABN6WIC3_9GAMM|nr:hypothetical protein [Marinomonas pontica]MCW8355932.1 hypothetical protein [Marinomonas pontica]BDX01771.1 hypothetical protein MACH16_05190 [Marinomonas pontica]